MCQCNDVQSQHIVSLRPGCDWMTRLAVLNCGHMRIRFFGRLLVISSVKTVKIFWDFKLVAAVHQSVSRNNVPWPYQPLKWCSRFSCCVLFIYYLPLGHLINDTVSSHQNFNFSSFFNVFSNPISTQYSLVLSLPLFQLLTSLGFCSVSHFPISVHYRFSFQPLSFTPTSLSLSLSVRNMKFLDSPLVGSFTKCSGIFLASLSLLLNVRQDEIYLQQCNTTLFFSWGT